MSEKQLDTVRLQNIAQGFGRSAALMSAVELGIFTAIDGGAITTEAVAAALYIHPVNAERLLVMLTAMELIVSLQPRLIPKSKPLSLICPRLSR